MLAESARERCNGLLSIRTSAHTCFPRSCFCANGDLPGVCSTGQLLDLDAFAF
jgi:hypothetical protein